MTTYSLLIASTTTLVKGEDVAAILNALNVLTVVTVRKGDKLRDSIDPR